MIQKLTISNFKSHLNTELKLSKINLLTGMNGMGKSSIMQALLLLRQSHNKGLIEQGLELNGDLCNIGVAKDAIYQYAETDLISVILDWSENCLKWSFSADSSKMDSTFLSASKKPNSIELKKFNLFNDKFQYISAYRNGPTSDYSRDTSSVELFNQISRKEGRGELVAHFLHHFSNKQVNKSFVRSGNNTLRVQVEEWMREISPNVNVHIAPNDSKYSINYSFNRGKGSTKTNEYNSANVGFGVSYVLPIVVSTLHASKGSIILIENPESHIHPTGQAVLMELIAIAAQSGVQFIIETHSDHIINGLLVATKKGTVRPEDSTVHFFDRIEKTHSTKAYSMNVLPGGKIKDPPKGFFDQFDKDMKMLVGF